MLIGLFDDSEIRKIINSWDSNFPTYGEWHKEELKKLLPERIKTLKKNILDVINVLYERGQACLYDIDMALEKERVELGGRSCGISKILDNLRKIGIIGSDYPYRLKRSHRDVIDQIYLKNLFS